MSAARPTLTRTFAVAGMLLALLLRLVLPGLHSHGHAHTGPGTAAPHGGHGHAATTSPQPGHGPCCRDHRTDGGAPAREHAPATADEACLACTFDESTPSSPPPLPAPVRSQLRHLLPVLAAPSVLLPPRYRAHPSRAPPAPTRRVVRSPA
ncbi:MAG: DUF2946 family protein [Planctomycetes bacterium]|nr:DUF2946 family protein [Planctomycetota bacterium]